MLISWTNGGINKHALVELLRKHPGWNEDTLSIIFGVTVVRDVDPICVSRKLEGLLEVVAEAVSEGQYKTCKVALSEVAGVHAQYLPSDFNCDRVNRLTGVSCSIGQRTSRVINKICKLYGVDSSPEYNTKFAALADALNPLSIERVASLSVHPCDYLEMSNTSNSWSSCHNIEDGCYRAGTLSYMLDPSTMIFYTVENDYGTPLYEEPKVTREVFCYGSGVLLQSRLYPDHTDIATATKYRHLVQSAIAKCCGAPNLWARQTDIDAITTYVHTYSGAMHYPDYAYSEYLPSISLLKSVNTEGAEICVGADAPCLLCGEAVDESGELQCDDCLYRKECTACGHVIPESAGYYVNDEFYCADCVTFCDICSNPVVQELEPVADTSGRTIYVCEECLETNACTCGGCGSTFLLRALYERDGEMLCEDCCKTDESTDSAIA